MTRGVFYRRRPTVESVVGGGEQGTRFFDLPSVWWPVLAFTRRSSEESILDFVSDKNDYAWSHYNITAAGLPHRHTAILRGAKPMYCRQYRHRTVVQMRVLL